MFSPRRSLVFRTRASGSTPPPSRHRHMFLYLSKANGSPDRSQLAKREATRTLKRGSHSAEKAKQAQASYELYQQRFSERYRVGEQADRLVQIVDRYMPRIADENRAYVMRYPHKVGEMLQKAWKLRKKIRQPQKEAVTAKRKKPELQTLLSAKSSKKEADAVQKNLWR